jgi:hypothetical protein
MSPRHLGRCGWFWAWTGVGFGLALSFVAVFSIGPFMLPFVTLGLGLCAARRAPGRVVGVGLSVATLGIAAAFAAPIALLATPLATLAIGISPAVPRTLAGRGRALGLALLAASGAAAAVTLLPGAAVLVVIPLAMLAFAMAVAGQLRSEMSGLVAGAGLLGAAFGLLPAFVVMLVGLAAFPALSGRESRAAAP